MAFFPVIERDLRRAVRRPITYWLRVAAALWAVIAGVILVLPGYLGVQLPTDTGENLFLVLSLLALGYALVGSLFFTADSLSEEKREGTLGLLLVTGLRGFEIVIGKLAATSLTPFYGLVAVFPILAVSLTLGGVTMSQFWRMVLVLLNTLFFSAAVGLWVSSFSYHARRAMTGALIIVFLLTAGVPLLIYLLSGLPPAAQLRSLLFWSSPGYTCLLAFDSQYQVAPAHFWGSLFTTHFLGWLGLVLAAFNLSRAWLADPDMAARNRGSRPRRQNQTARNNPAVAQKELLETDPFLWMVRRDRRRQFHLWTFLIVVACFAFWGYSELNQGWLSGRAIFFSIYGLHTVLKLWVAWEACHRFAEDRRSGALELLLSTPLEVDDLVRGRTVGLKRLFLGPVIVILAADLFLLWTGLGQGGWRGSDGLWAVAFLATLGLFLADVYALSWMGLWFGLTAKDAGRGWIYTVSAVLIFPWVLFVCVSLGISIFFMAGGLSIGFGVLIGIWFACGYLTDLALVGWVTGRFHDHFRFAAALGQEIDTSSYGEHVPDLRTVASLGR